MKYVFQNTGYQEMADEFIFDMTEDLLIAMEDAGKSREDVGTYMKWMDSKTRLILEGGGIN